MMLFMLEEVKYKHILDIAQLTIKEKQITSIVGQSGSGKTTLLRLLNKLISPDSGEIYYQGQPLSRLDPISLRREVVMLPQSPAIFDGSIKDNLQIGLNFSQQALPSNEALYAMLELVKLDKKLDDAAEKLSGGEKQRIALGRVLLMAPEVLLLDEPSSALDDETEQLIIQAIADYTRDKQKSMIMVTHSKNVANNFSDDLIEIKKEQPLNVR